MFHVRRNFMSRIEMPPLLVIYSVAFASIQVLAKVNAEINLPNVPLATLTFTMVCLLYLHRGERETAATFITHIRRYPNNVEFQKAKTIHDDDNAHARVSLFIVVLKLKTNTH